MCGWWNGVEALWWLWGGGLAEASWDGCWGACEEWSANGYCGRCRLDAVLFCLGGEHAFGFVAVALAFAVFLVGVLDGDFLVHEVLPAHVLDRVVRGAEVGVGNEAVALGQV